MTFLDACPLREMELLRPEIWPEQFPYTVPAIRHLERISFAQPVTFLVGENGSGKSTFLEALACAVGSVTVGSSPVSSDRSLAPVREFSRRLRLKWSKRTKKGFFMRSEDFFGYARGIDAMRGDLEKDLKEIDHEYSNRSEMARLMARSAYSGQIHALKNSYGDGLDSRSHGESYLKLFEARFSPGGLYLLDEPEAPLSPLRQLAFLALLRKMLAQQAQFIIATHSPILLAYPEALILQFDDGPIHPVKYEELEHVQITRAFLENPRRYLDALFKED